MFVIVFYGCVLCPYCNVLLLLFVFGFFLDICVVLYVSFFSSVSVVMLFLCVPCVFVYVFFWGGVL